MTTDRFTGRLDADLVEDARRGDRAAFAELVDRHRRTALAVGARLLGSEDLAGGAETGTTVTEECRREPS